MGQIKHAKGLKTASIILGSAIALLTIGEFMIVLFLPIGSTYNALRCGTDFSCEDTSPKAINFSYLRGISDVLATIIAILLIVLVILIIVQSRNTKLRGSGGRDYMKMEKPKVSDEEISLAEDKDEPKG